MKSESESHSVVANSATCGLYSPQNSPGQKWSGQPFPSPGDLPNPGIEPRSPSLQADSLPAELPRKLKTTGVGSLFLLQGIFLIQELKLRVGNRVDILPNMGSRNWSVQIQRLKATVAMRLGQVQRFLSCDLRTGLHTYDFGLPWQPQW